MHEDVKKFLDDLKSKVSELNKTVADSKTDKEKLQKQLDEVMAKQKEAVRKGVYSDKGRGEDEPSPELIVEKSNDPKVQALQKWNDDVYMLSNILKVHPTELKTWKKHAPEYSELRKAMDTAESGGGSDWIPTEFSSDLIDRVRLETRLASIFDRIQMPSNPYKLPTLTADMVAYKVVEQTADGVMTGSSAYTNSAPTTSNVTLTATKLGSAVEFSEELTEDSIIPILPRLKDNMAFAMAHGMEDALVNGDTTATHQDADVTASADRRKLWNGLRKLSSNITATTGSSVDISTFSLANLRAMRRKMGKYGARPDRLMFVCSAKGYINFLGIDEVITLEKYGPNATVLQGELAKIDGIPLIVDEEVRDDLNASGVNDATTNNKGLLLLVYIPGFVIGEKRKITMNSFFDVRRDQTVLVNNWRGDFQSVYPASQVTVVRGINMTTN